VTGRSASRLFVFNALHDALAGVEAARAMLARTCQRLGGQDDAGQQGQHEEAV
jgi:hypothetical protein